MKYRFGEFELDTSQVELTRDGLSVALEPKIYDLLVLLVENRNEVVGKDEIFERVWPGVFVSETSISQAIKQLRKALGDTGTAQQFIRTLRGKGFRFVGEVEAAETVAATLRPVEVALPRLMQPEHGVGRPSIAVIRFTDLASSSETTLSRAIPAELISALSRLKWLKVIARGTSFQFDPDQLDPRAISERLEVRYILTGVVESDETRIEVGVDLQSASEGTLVWSERFEFEPTNINFLRKEAVASIVSALERNIPQFEAAEARQLDETQFDVWSHFHIGLTHAFRFTHEGNAVAAKRFEQALAIDPHFSRAHAGASFVHWQTAFMRPEGHHDVELERALAAAQKAVDINPEEPLANFSMGRALWLAHDHDASIAWLDRGLQINPNYAQCHYTKGLLLNSKGDYEGAYQSTQHAKNLSPLDPFYYGMLTNQMVSMLGLGDLENAFELAEQCVRAPGTYYYPIIWAAIVAELSGRKDAMVRWRDLALSQWPSASTDAMLKTFSFQDPKVVAAIKGSLWRMGIP